MELMMKIVSQHNQTQTQNSSSTFPTTTGTGGDTIDAHET